MNLKGGIKMKLSNSDRHIIHNYEYGYRGDEEGNLYNPRGKKLKPSSRNPHRRLTFRGNSLDGKRPAIKVHRFLAYQWFGDGLFKEGVMVRHLDGNPLNNRKDNLALGTNSDNMLDRDPEDRKKTASHAGKSTKKAKQAKKKARRVLRLHRKGLSQRSIAEQLQISKSTVSRIINRKTQYSKI
jgi:hypothetical protein